MRNTISLLAFISCVMLLAACGSSTTNAFRLFSLPTTCGGSCMPTGITTGPDGNLWFTESAGNKIGRMTPSGQIQEFPLPTTCGSAAGCGPAGIASGPDGNLWFAEALGNRLGRITPSGPVEEVPL